MVAWTLVAAALVARCGSAQNLVPKVHYGFATNLSAATPFRRKAAVFSRARSFKVPFGRGCWHVVQAYPRFHVPQITPPSGAPQIQAPPSGFCFPSARCLDHASQITTW